MWVRVRSPSFLSSIGNMMTVYLVKEDTFQVGYEFVLVDKTLQRAIEYGRKVDVPVESTHGEIAKYDC